MAATSMLLKNSVFLIFLALFIGLGLGTWLSTRNSDDVEDDLMERLREKDISIVKHQHNLDSLSEVVVGLTEISKGDGTLILSLKHQIYEHKLKELDYKNTVKRMSHDEKIDWILSRYDTIN